MNIFLVRHGKYQTDLQGKPSGLSREGQEEVTFLRKYLDAHHVVFDKAFSSTKKRALETAEILCDHFQKSDFLTPNADVDTAFEIIPKEGNILVVSHLPLLEKLSERLGELVSFEPATIAIFSDKGLVKMVTPS